MGSKGSFARILGAGHLDGRPVLGTGLLDDVFSRLFLFVSVCSISRLLQRKSKKENQMKNVFDEAIPNMFYVKY